MEISYPKILRRYLATFLDGILILCAFVFVSYLLQQDNEMTSKIRVGVIFALFFLYEPIFTSKLCTFGQRVMKIRVRQLNGKDKISILAAYGRIIVKVFLGVISFFTIPITKNKRGIHDFAAGSIVINVK